MKHVVLSTVAGLASVAGAQTASLSIVPVSPTFDGTVSSVITLEIFVSTDFGTHIAGGEFALDGFGIAGNAVDMVASAASWGALGEQDTGYDGNGNHNGLIFGQLIFPPIVPPAAESSLAGGSVLLGTVVVTMAANSFGMFGWETAAGGHGPFILEVYDENDGSFTRLTTVTNGSVVFFPAPSSIALLGFGGLIAGRRRR